MSLISKNIDFDVTKKQICIHLDDEFGMSSNSNSHHHHHHLHHSGAGIDADDNLRHLEPRLLLGSDFHLAPSPTPLRRDVTHQHQQQQYLYLGGTGGRNLKPPMRNSMSRQSLMGKFRVISVLKAPLLPLISSVSL